MPVAPRAGADGVALLWLLNPYTASLTSKRFNTGSRPCVRNYTCSQFSADGDWLFCGSSTGDFTTFNVRSVGLKALTACCGGGVLSISVAGDDNIIVVDKPAFLPTENTETIDSSNLV